MVSPEDIVSFGVDGSVDFGFQEVDLFDLVEIVDVQLSRARQ